MCSVQPGGRGGGTFDSETALFMMITQTFSMYYASCSNNPKLGFKQSRFTSLEDVWEYCASGRRRTGVDRITNIKVRGLSKSRGLICLLLGSYTTPLSQLTGCLSSYFQSQIELPQHFHRSQIDNGYIILAHIFPKFIWTKGVKPSFRGPTRFIPVSNPTPFLHNLNTIQLPPRICFVANKFL